ASPSIAAGRAEETAGKSGNASGSADAAPHETMPAEAKPEVAKVAESNSAETKPAQPPTRSASDPNPTSTVQSAAAASEKPADANVEAKTGEAAAPPTTKADTQKPVEPGKGADANKPADAAKDQARPPDATKREAPKRSGQIAVFISRKDSKLYVR